MLVGVEIQRYGLQDELQALAEALRIPVAATLLGKSVLDEKHAQYIGVYGGVYSDKEVNEFVENSDCIMIIGTIMSDVNTGMFSANLDPKMCINVSEDDFVICGRKYDRTNLQDFIHILLKQAPKITERHIPECLQQKKKTLLSLEGTAPITIAGAISLLNQKLDPNTIVVAEIGDSLFSAGIGLKTIGQGKFIGSAYYASMGFSIPATLGVQVASPSSRVVSICGDGSFQMSGMELSTIVRQKLSPIIVIFDNNGYGMQRALKPG
eukprot:15324424-Ditylum_brightwellii.AAC.1